MEVDNINEKFTIKRVKRKEVYNMADSHWHNHYEIYYLISGSIRYFINHTLYTVEKGDVILIPEGELHKTMANSPFHDRFLVNFKKIFLKNLKENENLFKCFEKNKLSIPLNRRGYVLELLCKMENEYENPDKYSALLLTQYLCELLVFFNRLGQKQSNILADRDFSKDKIQEAAKYIFENYEKTISLKKMAEMCFMSESYFSRRFKAVTGFGFNEYLNSVRIKAATELLLSSKKSITEVGFLCGFHDSNYFGDVFKKIKGISPQKYRKLQGVL